MVHEENSFRVIDKIEPEYFCYEKQEIKRHYLTSASSVQLAISKLLEKDIITESNKSFSINDRFFAMWINRIYADGFRL